MKRNTRNRWIGMLSLVLIAVAAIVVVLLAPWQSYSTGTVFAGTNDDRFTATSYADVIRFEADGVVTLQVRIFDLSGKELWDSGVVSSWVVDWNRRNEFGERLAYGVYLYSAQGWDASGDLNFQKNGKLALMPGDKVQLQAAPITAPVSPSNPLEDQSLTLQPKGLSDIGRFGMVGVGTTTPSFLLDVVSSIGAAYIAATSIPHGITYLMGTSVVGEAFIGSLTNHDFDIRSGNISRIHIVANTGNIGIGTRNATAKLTVQASSGDLIAAYNSSNRVFVVKNNGEVRADGSFYGANFITTSGAADVAERINVSEWVDAGYVVEIDPDHPGFFRKSSSPYSTKVAGIISTSPGVILGNSFDEATDDWEDNRPVLAVTGRVPCKVSAENGPIEIGDLLVASSTPGVAMKGNPEEAMGAVVGKAMEPLKESEGTIVVQVMLR